MECGCGKTASGGEVGIARAGGYPDKVGSNRRGRDGLIRTGRSPGVLSTLPDEKAPAI